MEIIMYLVPPAQISIAANGSMNALSVTCLILQSNKKSLIHFSSSCVTMLSSPAVRDFPKQKPFADKDLLVATGLLGFI